MGINERSSRIITTYNGRWGDVMFTVVFRTVVMYVFILIAVRIMGKRQISQLQNSELVVTLLISELAVMPIDKPDEPIWQGLAAMTVLILCEIVVSFLMLKNGRFRRAVCGKPIVIIEDGKILQKQMRRLRMSTEDLFEQLRQNGVFSLDEVTYAIIETNGLMSVIRHKKDEPLTPKLAGIAANDKPLQVVVISDGEISDGSLALCGKNRQWLAAALSENHTELSDVFIMTAGKNGEYRIIRKE